MDLDTRGHLVQPATTTTMPKYYYCREQVATFDADNMEQARAYVGRLRLQAADDQSLDPGELSEAVEDPERGLVPDGNTPVVMPEWPMGPAAEIGPQGAEAVIAVLRRLEDEILSDSRWHHNDATRMARIDINAPLALIQSSQAGRLGVVQQLLIKLGEKSRLESQFGGLND